MTTHKLDEEFEAKLAEQLRLLEQKKLEADAQTKIVVPTSAIPNEAQPKPAFDLCSNQKTQYYCQPSKYYQTAIVGCPTCLTEHHCVPYNISSAQCSHKAQISTEFVSTRLLQYDDEVGRKKVPDPTMEEIVNLPDESRDWFPGKEKMMADRRQAEIMKNENMFVAIMIFLKLNPADRKRVLIKTPVPPHMCRNINDVFYNMRLHYVRTISKYETLIDASPPGLPLYLRKSKYSIKN